MSKVVNVLFCFLLAVFVLEFSLGIQISKIPGLSLKNIVIYGLLAALFLGNSSKNKPLIAKNNVNIPIVLYILYVFVSVINTKLSNVVPDYSLSAELILLKSLMDPYVLFIITYSILHDEESIEFLLYALIALFVTFLMITVLASFGFIEVARVSIDAKYGRTRGAFSEPNQFAAYMVMFMPLVWVFVYRVKTILSKVALIAIILLAVYVLLLTGSRGGLVSIVVTVGVYYLLSSRQPFIRSLFILVGVYSLILFVFALVFMMLPEKTATGLMSKITGKFSEEEAGTDYSSGRFDIWQDALDTFVENPVLGTGWNTFTRLFHINSHSDFVLYLVTIGIVGLCLFLFIYFRIFKSVWLYRKFDKNEMHFYNAFISGFSGYVTSMVFVNILTPMYFTLMYSALIMKLGQLRTNKLPENIDDPGAGDLGTPNRDIKIHTKHPRLLFKKD